MKTSNLSGAKKSSTNKRANGAPPKPRATPKTPTKEQIVSDFQVDLADSYIGDLDWRVKENSNMGSYRQFRGAFLPSVRP